MSKQRTSITTSFFYGWIILMIAALGLFFSGPGQTYSISIFIDSYINRFQWSRSMVSAFYSAATLTAGLFLPYVGRLIDVLGHRKMFSIIPTLLGIACLWMSFVNAPFMLFIGFMGLRLFGQGSMTLLPSTLAPQWFVQRRGLAVSLMGLGGVLGSAVLPVFNNWMITLSGTAFAWRFWSIALILFMAPIGWMLVKNRPEDIGQKPDGKMKEQGLETAKAFVTPIHVGEHSWTLKQAMKTRAFWFMLFCMMIPAMINTGITFHIISIMKNKGFSSSFAASLLSIMAVVHLLVNFIAGYIIDQVKVHHVKTVNFAFFMLVLLLILYGNSKTTLILYAVFHGIFSAFDSISTEVLWPNYFGRQHLGSIRGLTMTAMVIGSALGPLPFGFAYDLFQGYKEIMLLMMVFPLLGSIAAFLSSAPIYQE